MVWWENLISPPFKIEILPTTFEPSGEKTLDDISEPQENKYVSCIVLFCIQGVYSL